jgi:ABC-type Fe3+-hydroxamate transport system substrate-binding protein
LSQKPWTEETAVSLNSDIVNVFLLMVQVSDTLASIMTLGEAVGLYSEACLLVDSLRARLRRAAASVATQDRPRVLLLQGMDPLQLGGHWAFEMVTLAGGYEGLQKPGCPPETLHFQRLTAYAPEVLILAPRWSSLDRSLAEVNTFPCCAFYAITFNIFIGACLYSLSLHPSSAGKTLNFFLLILEQFFS